MYEFLLGIYSVGLGVAIICLLGTYLQKPSKSQNIMVLISLLALIISLGYWFAIQSRSLATTVFSYKLIYFGASSITFAMLMFFLCFYEIKISKIFMGIGSFLCFAITCSALLMDRVGWFYKSYVLTYHNGIPVFTKEYGVMHTLYLVMNYTIFLVMIVLVIYQMKKYQHKGKKLAEDIILLGVTGVPMLEYTITKLTKSHLDLNSIGILISEIMILFLVYKMKIYDISDTAREFIVNSMGDGVVVLDKNKIYKGANLRGKQLFPELEKASPNIGIHKISTYLSQVMEDMESKKISCGGREYETLVRIIQKDEKIDGYIILHRDITESEASKRILRDYQKNLEQEVAEKTAKIVSIQEKIIISFANVIESRDFVTGEHGRRTEFYVRKIIEGLIASGEYKKEVDESFQNYMYAVAPLHDIGKIAVPDTILNKPGKLTEEEYNIMKTHTERGGDMIRSALCVMEDDNYIKMAYDTAVYHHEKWNGKGYPKGLEGEEIPLSARIMAIADVFDALISTRIYKPAYSIEEAFSIIKEEREKAFDPILVDLFLKMNHEIQTLAMEMGFNE